MWERPSGCVTGDRRFDIDHGLFLAQQFGAVFDDFQRDVFRDASFGDEMRFENVHARLAARVEHFVGGETCVRRTWNV